MGLSRLILDWKSVERYNYESEVEKLERWAERVWKDGGTRAIEIGCWKGYSTLCLAQFFKVLAIDLWGDVNDGNSEPDLIGRHSFPDFIKSVVDHNVLGKRVIPFIGTSDVLMDLSFGKADLIFIDGNHSYAAARRDYLNVRNSLQKERGLVVFHDYKRDVKGHEPGQAGVEQLVDELVECGELKVFEHFEGIIALHR